MYEMTETEISMVNGGAIDWTGAYNALVNLLKAGSGLLGVLTPLLASTQTFVVSVGTIFGLNKP